MDAWRIRMGDVKAPMPPTEVATTNAIGELRPGPRRKLLRFAVYTVAYTLAVFIGAVGLACWLWLQ